MDYKLTISDDLNTELLRYVKQFNEHQGASTEIKNITPEDALLSFITPRLNILAQETLVNKTSVVVDKFSKASIKTQTDVLALLDSGSITKK